MGTRRVLIQVIILPFLFAFIAWILCFLISILSWVGHFCFEKNRPASL
ncbi:Mpo1-like protein [Effusibacillus consociatus]|uniref:Mpo1-like protein n=1 Tax=Effusibacillus consociatus TaxID=1117041 RepID=A0ABV9Q6F9_9BACL